MQKTLPIIRERRAALRQHFDVVHQFEALEESCVPSYLHKNPIASGIALWRLALAAKLGARLAPVGPILDFGASSGELWHLLGRPDGYAFVEAYDIVANCLQKYNQKATRKTIEALPERHYAAIFALDSLEHNDDVGALLDRLSECLADKGVLILSGPTETWLYRLGRKLVGFDGHYHKTTIYDIENLAALRFKRLATRSLPLPGIAPLFRLSVWSHSS